jgi:hypothetical protein
MTISRVLRSVAAGALLVNAVPHGAHAALGLQFPTPVATPPGVGLSSPKENAAWSCVNLALGVVLARGLDGRSDKLAMGLGGAATGAALAAWYGSH